MKLDFDNEKFLLQYYIHYLQKCFVNSFKEISMPTGGIQLKLNSIKLYGRN